MRVERDDPPVPEQSQLREFPTPVAALAFFSQPRYYFARGHLANRPSASVPLRARPAGPGDAARGREIRTSHSDFYDTRTPPDLACAGLGSVRSLPWIASRTLSPPCRNLPRTKSAQSRGPRPAPLGFARRSPQVLATVLLQAISGQQPCASGRLQACARNPRLTLLKVRGTYDKGRPDIRFRDNASPTCLLSDQPAHAGPPASGLRSGSRKNPGKSRSCRAPREWNG